MGDLEVLRGGLSVVTGSASGIGYALAKACLSYGMHVVLVDFRADALVQAAVRLRAEAGDLRVESFQCDVGNCDSVTNLLASVQGAFPNVPIQFVGANAGVMLPQTTVLSGTAQAWEFMHRVNVLGVVHILKTFVPAMCAQDVRGIVEVTSSGFGVVPGMRGPYGSSKLAALGVAEAMYYELKIVEAATGKVENKLTFVALCPTTVATDIINSTVEVAGPTVQSMKPQPPASLTGAMTAEDKLKHLIAKGMPADFCASEVFRHAKEGRFYCLLDNDLQRDGFTVGMDRMMQARVKAMLSRDVPPPLPIGKSTPMPVANNKHAFGCFSFMGLSTPPVASNSAALDLKDLRGGVAVITGSASGIGLALAREALAMQMHVVLSDIRESVLQSAASTLRASSGRLRVEPVVCDVTNISSVHALLTEVQNLFPDEPIQFVGANAGVILPRVTVLTGTTQEWEMTYRVNVLGVVNTLQVFMPTLVQQPHRSIVEVSASGFGVVPGLRGGSVGVAEAAYYELKAASGAPLDKISLVVLCPAVVKTDILFSSLEATDPESNFICAREGDAASQLQVETFMQVMPKGMPPDVCAKAVFQYAQEGRFYCILDNDPSRDGFSAGTEPMVQARMEAILRRGNPPVPRALVKS